MCRMMAKVSTVETSVFNELENCPHSLRWLSEHGRQSEDPDVRGRHADGCGFAFVTGTGGIEIHKRGKTDFWDASFHEEVRKAESKLFIAHDRLASSGLNIDEKGSHPFLREINGTPAAFCHNGTVRSLVPEAQERGISDSEIMLERIASDSGGLDFDSVYYVVRKMAREFDYSSMTAFLLTPEKLFAWRVYSEKKSEDLDRYSKYYTLFLAIRKNHILLASEPLDDSNGWGLIPNLTFAEISPAAGKLSISMMAI